MKPLVVKILCPLLLLVLLQSGCRSEKSEPAQPKTYALTVVVGQHGKVNPTGGTYNEGTVVNLTATPDAGYRISYWKGTDNDNSIQNSNTVTMTGNKTVEVAFTVIAFTLKVIVGKGVNGNLTTSTATYAKDTQVPYTFTPAFGHSQALVVVDGTAASVSGTIAMDKDHWLWAFGNPINGTPFSDMMVVPSDVTLIPYPEFYQKPFSFSFNVEDPYCALTSDLIAYPANYLGAFPMPDVQGAPLPANIRRGVGPKDYWIYGFHNASTNKGCTGEIHDAFLSMLQRLKKLNVDYIVVTQYTTVLDSTAALMQIDTGPNMSISDSELAWIVSQAKNAGFNAHEFILINGDDNNHVLLPTPPSRDWASRFLDAYTQFIVNRATVAQQLGIDAFQLDWGAYWFDWTPYKDLFLLKMAEAAKQVRNVYQGKILIGSQAPLISAGDPNLLSQIDWFVYGLPMALTEAENANITVSMWKQKFAWFINSYADVFGPNKKPMVWSLSAESYRDFPLKGWIEDGFDTGQQNVQIDFSVQALAYEAALEAIAAQTGFTTAAVEQMSYWYVDVILPKDSFPNLSHTFRNKPAESIFYQWFRKQ